MNGVPVAMAEDFDHKHDLDHKEEDFQLKYVGYVAAIIGIVIIVIGFAGILVNLFVM